MQTFDKLYKDNYQKLIRTEKFEGMRFKAWSLTLLWWKLPAPFACIFGRIPCSAKGCESKKIVTSKQLALRSRSASSQHGGRLNATGLAQVHKFVFWQYIENILKILPLKTITDPP